MLPGGTGNQLPGWNGKPLLFPTRMLNNWQACGPRHEASSVTSLKKGLNRGTDLYHLPPSRPVRCSVCLTLFFPERKAQGVLEQEFADRATRPQSLNSFCQHMTLTHSVLESGTGDRRGEGIQKAPQGLPPVPEAPRTVACSPAQLLPHLIVVFHVFLPES